jgi:hypothetical protein
MSGRPSSRSDGHSGARPGRIRQIERDVPADTISDMCFAQRHPILCVTSWDGTATVWAFSRDYGQEQLVNRRPAMAPKAVARGLTGRFGSTSLSTGSGTGSTFGRSSTGLSQLKPPVMLQCCFRDDDELIYLGDSYGFIHQ